MVRRRAEEEEDDQEEPVPPMIPESDYARTSREQKQSAILSQLPEVKVWDPTVVRVDEDMLRLRRVYVFDSITAPTAKTVIQSLHWLEEENTRRPITVVVSSNGGEVFPSLAVYDTIRSLKPDVTVVVLGNAFSGASIILQAGDRRLMGAGSWLMIHEPWESGFEGSATKMLDEAAILKRLSAQFLDIYASRTRVPRKKIEQSWDRKDFHLNAAEAVEWGFADAVLPVRTLARRARR